MIITVVLEIMLAKHDKSNNDIIRTRILVIMILAVVKSMVRIITAIKIMVTVIVLPMLQEAQVPGKGAHTTHNKHVHMEQTLHDLKYLNPTN